MARPFKVLIPEQKEQFGVVARSLRVMRDSIQRRCGLKSGFKIFLTDGTTVDNEEYFAFLEPQTLLIVKHAIPSGDTKTSVVDLTSKQVEALVCTEKNNYEQTYHEQAKNYVSDKHPAESKSAGTQSSAVLSIKIAKVQEDVEWENGGTSVQPNASSSSMHYQQQQQASSVQTDPNATITLHHLNHMSYPTSQMAQTYSTPATSRASVTAAVHHHNRQPHHQQQLQSVDIAVLQELYQQGQLQKRYYHQQQQQQQQIMSQTQACNAALRPSQRYYLQQQQLQQVGRNRNLQILRQLSSCGYNGTERQQKQQQLMYIPPQ